jgi:hypothetical protein
LYKTRALYRLSGIIFSPVRCTYMMVVVVVGGGAMIYQ